MPLILVKPYKESLIERTIFLHHLVVSDSSNKQNWIDATGKVPTTSFGSGSVNGTLWFTNSNNCGASWTNSLFGFNADFTVEWFYTPNNKPSIAVSAALVQFGKIIFWVSASPADSYNWRLNLNLDGSTNTNTRVWQSPSAYPYGHVALARKNRVLSLYFAGNLVYQANNNTVLGTNIITIGVAGGSGYGYALTSIQEPRISSISLYEGGSITPPAIPLSL